MILVTVRLISAIDPSRDQDLGRMIIANVGGDMNHGDYSAYTYRGKGKDQLDASMKAAQHDVTHYGITRFGKVLNHPRKAQHVWNLVAKALVACDYG